MEIIRTTITILAIALASPCNAQGAQVLDETALKQQADVMRKAWKLQPDKPIAMTIPLFGRVLRVNLPVGFIQAHQAQSPRGFISEFVPDGDKIDSWTRLFTITSSPGIGSFQMVDAALATAIVGGSSGCSGTHTFKVLKSATVVGGATGVITDKRCTGVASGSYLSAVEGTEEHAIIAFLRDSNSIFTVQLARRGKANGDGAPLISAAETDNFIAQLTPLFLCEAASALPACKEVLLMNRFRADGAKP